MSRLKKDSTKSSVNKQDIHKAILDEKGIKEFIIGSGAGASDVAHVSSSSFWLDYHLGGGYRIGSWTKLAGEPESGKTSMSLCWGKNWQDTFPEDGFVLFFNAEGRLSPDLLKRSGINTSPDKFLRIDTNNANAVYNYIKRVLTENKFKYFIIVDSTDALGTTEDKTKNIGESRMMGKAKLSSEASQELSILITTGGHHLFTTSQMRIQLQGQIATKGSSGGESLRFYPSLVAQIKRPRPIFEDYSEKYESGKKIVGRFCEVKLEKTPNESTGCIVRIPIKLGQVGGVWKAYEAVIAAIDKDWHFYHQNGAWYEIDEDWKKALETEKIEYLEKIHGFKNLVQFFEDNPKAIDFIIQKCMLITPYNQ